MTIATATSRNDYTGNGVTVSFPYTYRVFVESDLRVTKKSVAGVETLQVLNTDYTVSGEGDEAGGAVVMAVAPATGEALTIRRVRPVTQETDVKNQNSFYGLKHEQAFDHFVMVEQQLQDQLDRTPKLAETDAGSGYTLTIPGVADRANKALGFDSNGNVSMLTVSGGGGGGGGIATSFQILAADPGAPTDSAVWYNSTTGRFRGRIGGSSLSFGMEREIDAQLYSGADPGAKINAAIAAASNGQVVDASGLSGTVTTTINISKAILLRIGSGLTLGVSPGIVCQKTAGSGSGDSFGSTIEGAGRGASRLVGPTGGVAIRVEGHDVTIRDLGIIFPTINAANCGIQVQPNVDPHVLRPNFQNLEIDGGGSRTAANGGDGITFQTCFPGSVRDCHIHGWLQGIRHKLVGGSYSNAIFTTNNRIYDNTEGIRFEKMGDAYVYMNTIEGNAHYGIHILDGFGIVSEMNHYEQTLDEFGAYTATNIFIEGLVDAFTHNYTFKSDSFGTPTISTGYDILLGNGQNQYVAVEKCYWNAEISIGTGQPPVTLENSRQIGAARLSGRYVQMKSLFSASATTWEGPSENLKIQNWNTIQFPKTYTNTNGTVSYFTITNTLDPAGASSANYQALVFSTIVEETNAQNFTNVIHSFMVDTDFQGTGTASNIRNAYFRARKTDGAAGAVTAGQACVGQIENTVASTWAQAATFTALGPTNSGGGTITDWYGFLANNPTAAGITNPYAFRSFGGNVHFTIASASYTFKVITGGSGGPDMLHVSGSTDSVAVGGTPAAASKFTVNSAWTDTGTAEQGQNIVTQFNPSGGTRTVSSIGIALTTFSQTANAEDFTGVMYGINNSLEHRGTGTASDMRSLYSRLVNSSTGIVTLGHAARFGISNSSTGTISNGWGVIIESPSNASGTFTTYEGVRVTSPSSGTYSNYRGIYITAAAGTISSEHNAIRTDAGNVVLNENGGAFSVRVETDNVTNAFVVDGTNDALGFGRTTNTTSFFGITQPAATSGVKRMLEAFGGAHTGLTATTEVRDVYFDLSRTVNWASGAIATQRAFYIDAPTYSVDAGVSQAITTAATFALSGAPVAAGDGTTIANPYTLWIESGATRFQGRVHDAKGADVASANDLTLGADGNFFVITGATQINAITTAQWYAGSVIVFKFSGAPTVKHNTAGGAGTAVMLLAGSVDFVASANDTLVLIYDGTQWNELARSVI